jgi:hypothetical protein
LTLHHKRHVRYPASQHRRLHEHFRNPGVRGSPKDCPRSDVFGPFTRLYRAQANRLIIQIRGLSTNGRPGSNVADYLLATPQLRAPVLGPRRPTCLGADSENPTPGRTRLQKTLTPPRLARLHEERLAICSTFLTQGKSDETACAPRHCSGTERLCSKQTALAHTV